jgi:hypothetical protein
MAWYLVTQRDNFTFTSPNGNFGIKFMVISGSDINKHPRFINKSGYVYSTGVHIP